MITGNYPNLRLRRSRRQDWSRRLIQENSLSASDFILPIFLIDGKNTKQSIKTMPDVYRYTIDKLGVIVDKAIKDKIPMVALFPYTKKSMKNEIGTEALNEDNLVCKAIQYIKKRYKLIIDLHKNNLIRTNKAMMYGGTVELRTPFLHKNLVEFCLKIPPKFKKEGQMWKPMLRKAFKGKLSDELLFRPKKTFQEGCHTIYLKNQKDIIKDFYMSHYGEKNSLEQFMGDL